MLLVNAHSGLECDLHLPIFHDLDLLVLLSHVINHPGCLLLGRMYFVQSWFLVVLDSEDGVAVCAS